MVELRQIEEADAHTVRTQPGTALLAPQQVQVRNGEAATLRIGSSMPIRWIQSVGVEGRGRSSGSAGVDYGVVWMQSGQSLAVRPRWPGGRQAVAVQIDLQASSTDAATGNAELPSQSRSQLSTTVHVPLGQWTTVAASGSQPPAGTYSSEAAVESRRLVQIRVTAR